jgi:hypothetical protein
MHKGIAQFGLKHRGPDTAQLYQTTTRGKASLIILDAGIGGAKVCTSARKKRISHQ